MGQKNQSAGGNSLSSDLKRVIFGIVLVVIISFTISTYFVTEKEKSEYAQREAESVLRTLSENIKTDVERYTELSRLIITEKRLVSFLRADSQSVDISMINDARYGIMDILNVTEGIDTVMVFREDLIMLGTNRFTYKYDYDLMQTLDWRGDIYDAKGKAVVSLNSNKVAIKSDNKPMVTIGRAIYDINSQKRTGILMLNISANVFDGMLLQLRNRDICIMGDDGTFLAGNREYAQFFDASSQGKDIIHKRMKVDNRGVLVSECKIANLPIVIIRVSPFGVGGIPIRVICIMVFLLCVFIGVAVFTGTYIRKNITDPVFKLSDMMEQNRQAGSLNKIDAQMPNSELSMLEGDYNNMIDHVNELIERLMEKEKILQKSEMRVLQEQIKPHFLYNSLETIGFMALDAGADKVHDSIETLGSFYRNFLSKGGRDIPLSREVRIVRDYLALQKLRYGDILQDEYDIAPETEDFIVPKLILQPLVENSIYHGIRQKGEMGIISIKSFLVDKELHLVVKDTGVGMEEEQIQRILSLEPDERISEDSESFGLWGTIERIRFYCGRDDVVSIRSEIGEFTEIEITIVCINT